MATKSSRRRARCRQQNTTTLRRERKHGENEWQLDDLPDTGLDQVLNVPEDQPSATTRTPEPSSPAETNPSLLPPTSAVPDPSKQTPEKPSFFDLPAEIRLQIYSHYSQTLLSDHHLPIPYLPINASSFWPKYLPRHLTPQLLCHRFRTEYRAAWAADTTFVLHNSLSPEDPLTWLQQHRSLTRIWPLVRDFFAWLGPEAGREVSRVRVYCTCLVRGGMPFFADRKLLAQEPYTQMLRREVWDRLEKFFERLDDVREGLEVEVEVWCLQGWPWFLGAKRTVRFRQRPEGRRGKDESRGEWEVEVGELRAVKSLPERHQRRERDQARGEASDFSDLRLLMEEGEWGVRRINDVDWSVERGAG